MKYKLFILILCIVAGTWYGSMKMLDNNKPVMPYVAIANYGPHASLFDTIRGVKDGLSKEGFIERQNIRYNVTDVAFNTNFIAQMLSKLQAEKPDVLVTLATPVAQAAKRDIDGIPIVFTCVTDPVEAGILQDMHAGDSKITGASDMQDVSSMLRFAKSIISTAKTVGIMYSTGEANDLALLNMMRNAAKEENMEVFAIGVDESRDIPMRVVAFKDKADFIYVGSSGVIAPALPSIAAAADQMNIPILSVDPNDAQSGDAFASYGIDHYNVGLNGAKIVAQILRGESTSNIAPIYPTGSDHKAMINKKKAENLGIDVSKLSSEIEIVG